MTDDSTPQGTVEQEAPEQTPDALLDKFIGSDEPNDALEAEAEGADTDLPDEGQDDDAKQERTGQSRDELGRFVSDEAKVQLPDGTVTTISELKRGSLREADYTRKTQEVSALRSELSQRQAALAQRAQEFEQQINVAIQVATAAMPEQPDPALIHTDPIAYMQYKALYDQRLSGLQQLMAAKQQSEQAQAQQHEAVFRQWQEGEVAALKAAMPELQDPTKRQQFSSEIAATAQGYGFTDRDVSQIQDHRLLLALRDLTAYRKLQASKPKAMAKTEGKPPIAPNQRNSPQGDKQRSRTADWQKLRQSHGKDESALDRILDNFI